MARVTGIGGIFFKCADSEVMRNWYRDRLGLNTDEYGTNFEWRQNANPEMKGFTQWSPFKQESKYFDQAYMINYRVDDLDVLLQELKAAGVTIVDDVAVEPYGKFVHILDPEGNKVELWEPVDDEYEKILDGRTS